MSDIFSLYAIGSLYYKKCWNLQTYTEIHFIIGILLTITWKKSLWVSIFTLSCGGILLHRARTLGGTINLSNRDLKQKADRYIPRSELETANNWPDPSTVQSSLSIRFTAGAHSWYHIPFACHFLESSWHCELFSKTLKASAFMFVLNPDFPHKFTPWRTSRPKCDSGSHQEIALKNRQ